RVIDDSADTLRARMLTQASDEEALTYLRRAYESLKDVAPADIPAHLLGRAASDRKLAILYEAWHHAAFGDSLAGWLHPPGFDPSNEDLKKLMAAYGEPGLSWLDYAYLLDLHPIELWCGGELERHPDATWDELVAHSADVRKECQSWLFAEKHRGAQDLRLR